MDQETAESAFALVQQLKSTESGKALSSRQLLAIAALVTDSSHKAAAFKVGISPNTLCRWLKKSDFKAAHDLICRQLHESVFARAQAASGMAMNSLLQIAQHSLRNSDRIQATRIIFDLAGSATQRISSRNCYQIAGISNLRNVPRQQFLNGLPNVSNQM